jgi:hypothetical protein
VRECGEEKKEKRDKEIIRNLSITLPTKKIAEDVEDNKKE